MWIFICSAAIFSPIFPTNGYGKSNMPEKKDAKNKKSKVLEKKRNEAREQLERYRNSYTFAGRTDIKYLSLIFIGKDDYEMNEIE
jgi:hypothetical protein